MNHQRLVSVVLSLLGLFSVAFLSIELAHKWNEPQNGRNLTRKLQAPFSDRIPDRNLVLALTTTSADIFSVTDDMIKSATMDQVISWKAGWEFKYWLDTDDSTEAMVLKSTVGNKVPLIVFRGSEDVQDWMTNFDIGKRPFPNAPSGVEAHNGFQGSLFDNQRIRTVNEAKETQVLKKVNAFELLKTKALELMGDTNEIHVTGHSLGAALAQVMATRLADMLPDIQVTMINSGCPRVGNKQFKSWSEQKSNLALWRYVYGHDVVPRIPKEFQGFYHSGHTFQVWPGDYSSIYYHHDGNGGALKGKPWYWDHGTSVSDHSKDLYVSQFASTLNQNRFWPQSFYRRYFSVPSKFLRSAVLRK